MHMLVKGPSDPDKAEPPERKQWVVLFGTPTDGFVIVGPFEAYGDADEYRTDLDGTENG
jgi:hypothetical protein